MFSCESCEIFKNSCFTELFQWLLLHYLMLFLKKCPCYGVLILKVGMLCHISNTFGNIIFLDICQCAFKKIVISSYSWDDLFCRITTIKIYILWNELEFNTFTADDEYTRHACVCLLSADPKKSCRNLSASHFSRGRTYSASHFSVSFRILNMV